MKKDYYFSGLVLFFSFLVLSAILYTPVWGSKMWQKTYGGVNDDRAYSVIQTNDDGFALAGSTISTVAGLQDFYLVKTDENGNILWNRTYGGQGSDTARSLIQTSDGGYALAGDTTSFGNLSSVFLSYDFWLVKTDPNGIMLWNQTYGGYRQFFENGTEYGGSMANTVVQTSDGGYALSGRTYAIGAGLSDFYLVKTDENGNMLWNMTYGGEENDFPLSMIQTRDEGFALAGYTESFGAGNQDYWLIKIDSNGNMEWNQTFGGTGYDEATSLVQTEDGGYVLVGTSTSVENGDIWLIKTDSNGDMLWNKGYLPANIQRPEATSIIETSAGGYALSGNFWVIKTDANGDILFYQSFDPETGWYSVSNCLIQASNGDYVLAGYITPVDGGVAPDVLLVKTDNDVPVIWNVTRTASSPIENSTYTNLIKVNVYHQSGIRNVVLSYSLDGNSWNNITMTNSEGTVYSAEIEAYPKDTTLFWTIIAENNIGTSIQTNTEFYIVIPEFSSWIILPLFIIVTLSLIVIRKKLRQVY
jgi:hypothetical protein